MSPRPRLDDDDFFEEDEPVERVIAAFDAAPKVRTGRAPHPLLARVRALLDVAASAGGVWVASTPASRPPRT